MRALRLLAWQQPPELVDLPVPDPGPGEVLVRVAGSGACHSDIHLMDAPALPWPAFTLGHEAAGWVERTGRGVSGVNEGDAVIVYGPWGCGGCRACRTGAENYCDVRTLTEPIGCGLGRDGGHAEYVLVPAERYLVPIGDLDPVQAAPLADAALTPYHAIKRSLSLLHADSTTVVIGVGGLGHVAVQLLRTLSATRVIAVDVSEDQLGVARALGAHEAIPNDRSAADVIREATAGRGADLVLDLVGTEQTLQLAAQVVATLGHLTIVGIGGGTVPVGFYVIAQEASVATVFWGSIGELREVVDLARAGAVSPTVERFSLDRGVEAYERMREGTLRGRAVLVP